MTTIRQFIKDNRAELDAVILSAMYRHDGKGGRGVIPNPAHKLNDTERREWILNDEGLYRWARSQRIRI